MQGWVPRVGKNGRCNCLDTVQQHSHRHVLRPTRHQPCGPPTSASQSASFSHRAMTSSVDQALGPANGSVRPTAASLRSAAMTMRATSYRRMLRGEKCVAPVLRPHPGCARMQGLLPPAALPSAQEVDAAPAAPHLRVQVRGARLVGGAPHRLLFQDGHSIVSDDGLHAGRG